MKQGSCFAFQDAVCSSLRPGSFWDKSTATIAGTKTFIIVESNLKSKLSVSIPLDKDSVIRLGCLDKDGARGFIVVSRSDRDIRSQDREVIP